MFSFPRVVYDSRSGASDSSTSIPNSVKEEITDISNEIERFKENKVTYKEKVQAILSSFTTNNSLKQGWPEISAFVDDVCGNEPQIRIKNLPVQMDLMNKELNLPPESQKAV